MKNSLFLFCLVFAIGCDEKADNVPTKKVDTTIGDLNKDKTSYAMPNDKKTSGNKPTKDLLGIANAFDSNHELRFEEPVKKTIISFVYDKTFCLNIRVGSVLDGFNILEIKGDNTATLYTKPPVCKSIKIKLTNEDIVDMIELLNSKKIGQMSYSYNSDFNDGTHISIWLKNKENEKSIDLDNFFPEEIKSLVNWGNKLLNSKQAIITKISQKQYMVIRNQSFNKP